MAFNLSKEVSVARDAAKALDDAPVCVVLWLTTDGKKLGMSSYGKTMKLCGVAGSLGDCLYRAALKWDVGE